jgi:FimV-like protein
VLDNFLSQVASSDHCLRKGANKGIIPKSFLDVLGRSLDFTAAVPLKIKVTFGVVIVILMTLPSPAFALGVGSAETNSFIGQRLLVRIPLFNVSEPDSLKISFDSQQFGENGQVNVIAELDRANSQLAVKLSSDNVVNEPYVNFSLNLIDDNTQFSKKFTVLLNLSPQARNTGSYVSEEPEGTQNELLNKIKNSPSTTSQTQQAGSSFAFVAVPGSIMGPYETAVAGKIPERFGAVLDGQSLWRVARRIDSAMGVSRDQMMWALYQANPEAFASTRIESLKAGSYLKIPSVSIVNGTSDSQAKAKLRSLNQRQLSISSSENVVAEESEKILSDASTKIEAVSVSSLSEAGSNLAINPGSFQVTSINQPAGDKSTIEQSQMIVASLTETVGNMSQQLERKDRKIEFLEAQVQELKSFISAEELGDFQSQVPSVKEVVQAPSTVLELVSDIAPEPQDRGVGGLVKSFLPWALLALIVLGVAIYTMWGRIQNLIYKLNLFGRQDDMGFSVADHQVDSDPVAKQNKYQSVAKSTVPYRVPSAVNESSFDFDDSFEEGSISVYGSSSVKNEGDFHEEPSICFDGAYEYEEGEPADVNLKVPNIDSANTIEVSPKADVKVGDKALRVVKNGLPEGTFDGHYDESEMDETIEFLAEEITARENDEALTFEQRFDSLLQERDFDFARELLDFARYNEINDERYHFERLRMLEKMGDDDAFYEYYYFIEDEIPNFPQQLQTQISQLVVQIALN